jgi:hypothetical protein
VKLGVARCSPGGTHSLLEAKNSLPGEAHSWLEVGRSWREA